MVQSGVIDFSCLRSEVSGRINYPFNCWEMYRSGVEIYFGSLTGGVNVPEDDGVEVMMRRGVLVSMEVRWFWIGVAGWCCADGYAEGHRV